MSRYFFAVAIAVAGLHINSVDAGVEGFACSFSLSTGDHSIQRFTLNDDVYRCMRHANHADLVVVNSQGEPVPLVLADTRPKVPAEPQTYERDFRIYPEPSPPAYGTGEQIRRIGELTGVIALPMHGTQWQLANKHYSSLILERVSPFDTLKEIIINAETEGVPVSATLVIEESADMKHWTTLARPQVIQFLVGTAGELYQNTVALDSSGQSKYLRLAMLSNLEDFADTVKSVTGQFEQLPPDDEQPNWHWIKTGEFQALEKAGEWSASLPGLFPVSRIRFTPAPDMVLYSGTIYAHAHSNPAAEVRPDRLHEESRKKLKRSIKQALDGEVPGRLNDSSRWHHRAAFTQYRLTTETGSMSSSDVELPVTYTKQWKFAFNEPRVRSQAQLPTVEFGWLPRQVTFVTQGAGPFRLLVGRDEPAPRPEFPSHLFDATATVQAVELLPNASVSAAPQPLENGAQTGPEGVVWSKVLLWLLLCSGAGLMLTMAYRLSKKLK